MTQRDRDRLVTLKKANKKLITQKEAGKDLGISERQVRRLLRSLKKRGDTAVIHALRGSASNRRTDEEIKRKVLEILSEEVYRGFGPTLASEYLASRHKIEVSRETVRKWMVQAKLWKARTQTVDQARQWRERRSRPGEMVQWDTSEHDWLEGRGEKFYLIGMIDDATSRLFARFVRHDSTEENMRLLRDYLTRFGRPLAFYTDKASLFQTAVKTRRDQQREGKDQPAMGPTQIGRALQELAITWIAAHSPQAKGRIERSFQTAQDRLVKGLRVAGANSLEQANQYLEREFLPWWQRTLAVIPGNPEQAHRPLEAGQDLAAILSHVENRQVAADYTVRFAGRIYQIERNDIAAGLRGGAVRVERRLDSSIAMRFGNRYLRISLCEARPKVTIENQTLVSRRNPAKTQRSQWSKNFNLQKSMPLWKAARASGAKPQELL